MGFKRRDQSVRVAPPTRVRDPLYLAILRALAAEMDEHLFEQAACELLKKIYPQLSPVSGGGDGGMDGSIPDEDVGEAAALVCTTSRTSSKLIANLRQSLESYVTTGGRSRRVVFATPRAVSPAVRVRLRDQARTLGFGLLNTHAMDWFAPELYENSRWRWELLGVSGSPSILSAVPRGLRSYMPAPLVGRELTLQQLRTSGDDLILLGQPGSGKTRLLMELVEDGGLFVNSAGDLETLADELRDRQPRIVIVDDANLGSDLSPGFLEVLRDVRRQVGADFRIVASSWPAAGGQLQRALDVHRDQVITLERLVRDDIVALARALGIAGPPALLSHLADQADGRPGLLTTLVFLMVRGDFHHVVGGEALAERLAPALEQLIGAHAQVILGVLAVSGDAGLSPPEAARLLGMQPYELQDRLQKLDAAGVIKEVEDSRLAVTPPQLRWVLMRDTFFAGASALRLADVLDALPTASLGAAVEVLATARAWGVRVQGLWELAEKANSIQAWKALVSTGPDYARQVLRQRPDLLRTVMDICLLHAPGEVIPLALDAAEGDDRELGTATDHPLRRIQDWIHNLNNPAQEPADRRATLLDVALIQLERRGQTRSIARAMLMALDPVLSGTESDPGSGRTFTFTHSMLEESALASVAAFWPRVFQRIDWDRDFPWKSLFDLLFHWEHPLGVRGEPESSVAIRAAFVERVLRDLASIADARPGLAQEVGKRAASRGIDLDLAVDPNFADLFPVEDFTKVSRLGEWQEARARSFVDRHRGKSPSQLAARMVELDVQGEVIAHRWPRLVPDAASLLAAEAQEPSEWISQLVSLSAKADLIAPFVRQAAKQDCPDWRRAVAGLLESPAHRWLIAQTVLTLDAPPADLRSEALRVEGVPLAVKHLCEMERVPPATLRFLLTHEDPEVVAAAVEGCAMQFKEGPAREVADIWREAVIRAPHGDYWLEKLLEGDLELAAEWIRARFASTELCSHEQRKLIVPLIGMLSVEARHTLLERVTASHGPYDIVPALVGDDVELYRELLRREDLRDYHLDPLKGKPAGGWTGKALLAIEAGIPPDRIARACLGRSWGFSGDESAFWGRWVRRFEKLEQQQQTCLKEIARCGLQIMQLRLDEARRRERDEAVHGHR